MLNDPNLMKAVSSLLQRSEKREESKSLQTFVDPGIIAQIKNRNNQVIYGRRGTGKTHILQYLGSKFKEESHSAVLYIDARMLGSTSQFTDVNKSIDSRCTSLFRDVFCLIHNFLIDTIIEKVNDQTKVESALDDLSKLGEAATEKIRDATEESTSQKLTLIAGTTSAIGATLGTQPSIAANLGTNSSGGLEKGTSVKMILEDNVRFPTICKLTQNILETCGLNLYILFDEWSSLPLDIQPYLAEFFKRGLIPIPSVTLKIASLEYRSNFGFRNISRFVGFEMSSDLSATVDLDEYYVFDRNPDSITTIMSDILYKHISSELPEKYLTTKYNISSGADLASRMFTQRPVFQDLVRASEGVVRDLINIFNLSYFDGLRNGKTNIDKKSISAAALSWFETDKRPNLDAHMNLVLRNIVDDVIGKHQARSFLAERSLENHPMLQQLCDARVLHLVKRGYSDKDNPGRRYNIYTLDYGTYVDLINTVRQPQLGLLPVNDGADTSHDIVVPFDDKRSIRRVILAAEILK